VNKKQSIQTGLRITEERNAYLERRADETGISKNQLINVLIELGLKIYDGNIAIIENPNQRG